MLKGLSHLLGQDTALSILKRAFLTHRLHHAYLFEGMEGIGKATCAKALFATINCENPPAPAEICETCSSCQKVKSGNHPDLILFDMTPAGLAEQVEKLLTRMSYSPHESKAQMVIFDPADTFSSPTASVAANRLLKTLEEPLPNTYFIFICKNATNLLPTLRSRMQRIRFQPLPDPIIEKLLEEQSSSDFLQNSKQLSSSKEKTKTDKKTNESAHNTSETSQTQIDRNIIIDLSQGSIGSALQYQSNGEVWKKRQILAENLLQVADTGNLLAMMKLVDQEEFTNREESQVILQLMWLLLHHKLKTKLHDSQILQKKVIQQLALTQDAIEAIKRYISPTLTIERLLRKLGPTSS